MKGIGNKAVQQIYLFMTSNVYSYLLAFVFRVFWVLSLALSLAGCFYLIMKVYTKWDNSPVIVSFAETSTPIWQVPFPAVSICPETKSRQRVFNFTDMYHRMNDIRNNVTNITEVSDEE